MTEFLHNGEATLDMTIPPNLTTLIADICSAEEVSRDEVIADLQVQIETAAKEAFGQEFLFKAFIDDQGAVRIAQILTVVEDVTNGCQQVSLNSARKTHPDIKTGARVFNQLEYDELQTPFGILRPVKGQIKNMSLKAANG